MPENKVRFNLKNVHYALFSSTGYGTPVAVPGAVSVDLSPTGELSKFYADGITYYQSFDGSGYDGTLEMARITDTMLADVWDFQLGSTSKVLIEMANGESKPFALLFQIDGDADGELYVLYNCTASRPNINSRTNEETKTPVTQSLTLSCAPLSTGEITAKTTAATSSTIRSGWFSSVYKETTPTPTPS